VKRSNYTLTIHRIQSSETDGEILYFNSYKALHEPTSQGTADAEAISALTKALADWNTE